MSEALKELVKTHTLPVAPDIQRRSNHLNEQLFPIEKAGSAGQALLKELRCSADDHYAEFLPEGLSQTYRDKKTGLDLPVFAIFPLNSQTNTITCQIEFESQGDAKVVFHPALYGLASFSGLSGHLVPTDSVNSVIRRNRMSNSLFNIMLCVPVCSLCTLIVRCFSFVARGWRTTGFNVASAFLRMHNPADYELAV